MPLSAGELTDSWSKLGGGCGDDVSGIYANDWPGVLFQDQKNPLFMFNKNGHVHGVRPARGC